MSSEKRKVSNNFGVRGWLIIIFFGVMLFLNSSFTADGMNIIIPTLSAKLGIDAAQMLSINGIGGWIGVAGAFVLSALVQKLGAKKVIVGSLIIMALSVVALAFITNMAVWFAVAILFNILPGEGTFVVSAIFLGCALGGNTNFSTSMCASLFGRKNFQRAFNFLFPVSCIFRAAASVVLGAVLGASGGNYVAAYMVFLIGSVIAAVLFGCINMTPKEE